MILQSVISVILSTFSDLPKSIVKFNNSMEIFSIVVFTIEYIMRVYIAHMYHPKENKLKSTVKYIFSLMALIDLAAILPFYIPMLFKTDLRSLRLLRLLRMLRVFKLNRYFNGLLVVAKVIKNKKEQLLSSMFVVILLMVISSILMFYFEHDAQPEVFENAFSGLWWAIATLTTVGYGDIYPITFMGKVLSTFIALLGIALVAVPTGILSAGFGSELDEEKAHNYCPHCGHKLD